MSKGEYVVNYTGAEKLYRDEAAYESLISKYDWYDSETFIIEALSWLGLYNIDYGSIEEVPILIREVKTMEDYLNNISGERLFKEDQQKLANKIGLVDAWGRKQKSISQLNTYLDTNGIPYTIVSKTTKDKERKSIRFWEVIALHVK